MSQKSSFTSYLDDPVLVSPVVNTTTQALIDLGLTGPADGIGTEPQLCGYLNKYKQGARGIGKHFKKRWFVYIDNSCKLLYYRTPQDLLPLGEIEIGNASFSFEVGEHGIGCESSGRAHVFEISSNDLHYYLEAADQQTMMYWLQQLQSRRRAFSQRKTSTSIEKCQLKTMQNPSAGLVGTGAMVTVGGSLLEPASVMEEIEPPRDTVGLNSAAGPSGKIWSNVSISNWKTELRNAVSSIRAKRQADSDVTSRPRVPSPEILGPPENQSVQDSVVPETQHQHRTSRIGNLKRRIKSMSFDADTSNALPQTNASCLRCKQTEFTLCQQQEETQATEEELGMTRELVRILQKEIDVLRKEHLTRGAYNATDPASQLAMLHQKDKAIVNLEHLVANISEEKELLNTENKMLVMKVSSLEEDVGMFRDSLSAKDQVVVSLTNRLYDLEQGTGCTNSETQSSATNTTLGRTVIATSDVERLKDSVAAYKLQNQFLNKEILELNRLRGDDKAREKQIYLECKDWEAHYYQTQSKYLLAVEQLRTPQRGGSAQPEDVVSQLLDDALRSEDSSQEDLLTSQKLSYRIREKKTTNYDQYGFFTTDTIEVDLGKQADILQKKSTELLGKDVDKVIAINVRWENFLITAGGREIPRSSELKGYIREGVPYEYRSRIWSSCLSHRVGKLREQLGAKYYQNLLKEVQLYSSCNPATKQIELDLLRTLPNNRHYETLSSEGIPKLRRVLQAHAQHNPDVGYCQGQNRLVAIALLFLNEEDAFWCLVAITEYLMPPEYYSVTLLAAQVDQRVLKELVGEKMPRLLAHLEEYEVDLTLFTFNWFLTVFVDNIEPEAYLRVWDAFLYEGNKVLFRFAMAFLRYREEELLQIRESISLHRALRRIGEDVNVNRLGQIAFHEMNPLPMRHILTKRQFYTQKVKTELAELDQLRSQFRSTRSQSTNNDSLDLASDDDL